MQMERRLEEVVARLLGGAESSSISYELVAGGGLGG